MRYAWLRRAGVLCLVGGTVDLWALNDLVLPELYARSLPLPRVKRAHAATVKPVLSEPLPTAPEPVPATPEPVAAVPEPASVPMPDVGPPKPVVVLEFSTNSPRVERAALRRLAAALDELGEAPRISVVGHADASGPDEFNDRLSKKRADSVASTLVELGVARERLVITWHGERQPRADGDDKRVEIYLGGAP